MSDNTSPPTIHPGGTLSCPTCGGHRFFLTLTDPALIRAECGNPDCIYFTEITANAVPCDDAVLDIR